MRVLIFTIVILGCGRPVEDLVCDVELTFQSRTQELGGMDNVRYTSSRTGRPDCVQAQNWTGIPHLRIEITSNPSPGYVDYLSVGSDRIIYLSLPLSKGSNAAEHQLDFHNWKLPWETVAPFEIHVRVPTGDTNIPLASRIILEPAESQ